MRDYTIHGYSLQTEQEGEYLDVALQGRCQRYQLLDICKTVDMSWQYGTQLETRQANKNCKPVCKVRRWGLSTHQQHNSHQRTTLVGIPSRKESQSQSYYGLQDHQSPGLYTTRLSHSPKCTVSDKIQAPQEQLCGVIICSVEWPWCRDHRSADHWGVPGPSSPSLPRQVNEPLTHFYPVFILIYWITVTIKSIDSLSGT